VEPIGSYTLYHHGRKGRGHGHMPDRGMGRGFGRGQGRGAGRGWGRHDA
jgi:hypothetical protein